MNEERPNAGDNELEAYLDGRLDLDARRRFEQTLRHRADRRRAVQLQQRIDQRLQSAFIVPPIPPLVLPSSPAADNGSTTSPKSNEAPHSNGKVNGHDRLNGQERPIPGTNKAIKTARRFSFDRIKSWRPPTWFLVAVILSIGAITAWSCLRSLLTNGQPTFEQVYESVLNEQILIEVKQTDDRRFTNTFHNRNRQALKLVDLPKDIQIDGLAYVPVMSAGTTVLVTHTQGQPVVVIVDHRRHDRAPPKPDGLQMFRDTRGEAVVYEITPFEKSLVSPHLQVTEPVEYCRPGSGATKHAP